MKKFKFTVIFAVFMFTFCTEDKDNNPVRLASGQSGADIEIMLGGGPLPHKLMVELSAGGQEARYDTVEVKNTRVNCRFLNIAPYKEWTVKARTVDKNDSAVQSGSSAFMPLPNRMTQVFMELQSKYFKMQALFSPVRDNMTRVEILIDDKYIFASPVPENGSDTAIADADYVPLKNEYKITGKVFGLYGGAEVLLFAGDTAVTLPWYDDRSVVFTLKFKPSGENPQGPSSMTVLLRPFDANTGAGRIGQPVYFSGTGHYYDAVTLDGGREISWDEAKAAAASLSYKGMRGHLAVITNAAENEFIWRYLAAQSGVSSLFIGGYQFPVVAVSDTANWDKNWNWVTGEPWSYKNWAPGEPNKFAGKNGNEIWLMMWAHSGKWNDQFYRLSGFIVEYE
jgi:hypothetical protein